MTRGEIGKVEVDREIDQRRGNDQRRGLKKSNNNVIELCEVLTGHEELRQAVVEFVEAAMGTTG